MGLLRGVIESVNRVLGRLKRSQRVNVLDYVEQGDDVRINVGCGLAVTKGWVNIDGSLNALIAVLPKPFHSLAYRLTGAKQYYTKDEYCTLLRGHKFVHHDLVYGLPVDEGVVDCIYSSHFFEHLYRQDAKNLLSDCYRALKEGGLIRVSIPDLHYAVSLYEKGKKEEMLKNYFFVEDDDSNYARHKYMYDYEMLSALLLESGFCDVRQCQYQVGAMPDIDILDNRPQESLFVEARK